MPGSPRPDTDSPTGPSRGFVAAAALLALVAVGLVVVLVISFTGNDTPPTATAPATPVATSSPATTVGSSSAAPSSISTSGEQGRPAGCASTGTDQTVPTSTPAGITWTLAKGTAVPSSSTDGPALRDPSGVGYCYARTPLGAMLAVSNFGRGTGDADSIKASLLNRLTVTNEYTAALAAQPSTPSTGPLSQLAGIRVVSYTPNEASVTIAVTTATTGTYGMGTAVLRWDQGDWRLVPQAGPAFLVSLGSTQSLAGFVPWSGVSN